jgi:type IV pilus assembly protein PilV
MLSRRRPPSLRRVRGTSLVEVLVAMLLLLVGILPLAMLHARAMQATRVSQHRTTEVRLAADLSERMRANLAGVDAGAYDRLVHAGSASAQAPAPCGEPAACTPQEMAERDMTDWTTAARASLPGAALLARRMATGPAAVDVWVAWRPVQGADGEGLRADCPAELGDAGDIDCLQVRVTL